MKQNWAIFAACIFIFQTSLLRADQTFVVAWSKSESYLQGQDQRHVYEPKIGSLYYSYSMLEGWTVGASLWSGNADKKIGEFNFELHQEHSGGAVSLNYIAGNWGVNLGLSQANSEIAVRSSTSMFFYRQQNELNDFNISIDYLFSFERFEMVPSIGLGFQTSNIDTQRTTMLPGSFSINDQFNEDQKTTYSFAGFSFNTWFDLGHEAYLLPAVDLGWSEILSGESAAYGSRTNKTLGKQRSFGHGSSSIQADGSGYVGFSLALLIKAFQVGLSYTQTVDVEENTETAAVDVGVSF